MSADLASFCHKMTFFLQLKIELGAIKVLLSHPTCDLATFPAMSKFIHLFIENPIIIICCSAGYHMSRTFDKSKLFCC